MTFMRLAEVIAMGCSCILRQALPACSRAGQGQGVLEAHRTLICRVTCANGQMMLWMLAKVEQCMLAERSAVGVLGDVRHGPLLFNRLAQLRCCFHMVYRGSFVQLNCPMSAGHIIIPT